MAQKIGLPKGTRDFDPIQMLKRKHIFSTVEKAFQKFGFQPIETPSFENYATLMGKYGEEGDRLIFKILNSGDYLKKSDKEALAQLNSNALTPSISEKALRYDLTVPFARYVVQHQNELTLPFKRYQIQPVWRADRPQKGRFREFYQCDADVVGSQSLFQELDFIQLYDEVFTELGLKGCTIKLNNRKILFGFAQIIQAEDKLIDFTVALDKLDKIGRDKVIEEMLSKGISADAISKIDILFDFSGSNQEKIEMLTSILAESEIGLQGLEEMKFIIQSIEALGLKSTHLDIDITLARGLNYYTGTIFEVAAPEGVSMGSIGGGGRYDDLTSIFGLKNISGVGISFGLDRIYLVMEDLGLFENVDLPRPEVLFINFGVKEALHGMKAIRSLRDQEISAELYPESSKMKKQMNYANKRNIPFVVLIGEEEMKSGKYTLKDMSSGHQETVDLQNLIKKTKR